MQERSLQDKIIKYINSKDIYCFKTITNNRRGIPDIIVCYNGIFISIEVKSDNGKLSMLQMLELQKIKKAGGFYLLATNFDLFVSDFNFIINCIDMNRVTVFKSNPGVYGEYI